MQKPTLNHIFLLIIYIVYINIQTSKSINKIDNCKFSKNNVLKFQSKKNVSLIFNQTGELTCKLISEYVQYFENTEIAYIHQPTATLFDKTNTPTWNINAKQAQISNKKIIYLYGNVQITNLIKNSHFQSITTNAAILNLITHDIISNGKINIYGKFFHTIAKKLQGNLNTKNIELSRKVHTLYETKKSKKI